MEQRIFITGGASGLGRALAERYAKAGARVLIGDVNEAGAVETVAALTTAGAKAAYVVCDVRKVEDFEAAAAWLEREWGGVDVVVNNAGVAVAGSIAETPLDDWSWIIDINLMGVVRGCKVFAPMFLRQRKGHFVNVSSMAGLIHPPFMPAYAATKAAVVALSESIAAEMYDHGVRVSVVCPAFFRTNLHTTMRAASPTLSASTNRLVGEAKRGATEIAELVYQGIEKRDFYILTHPEGRAAWLVKRLVPYAAYRSLMHRTTNALLNRGRA